MATEAHEIPTSGTFPCYSVCFRGCSITHDNFTPYREFRNPRQVGSRVNDYFVVCSNTPSQSSPMPCDCKVAIRSR